MSAVAIEKFLLLTEDQRGAKVVASILARAGEVSIRNLHDDIVDVGVTPQLFVDVDLGAKATVERLRKVFAEPGLRNATRWFLIKPDDYRDRKQALALGAHKVVERPLSAQSVLEDLRNAMASEFMGVLDALDNTRLAVGVRAAHEVLHTAFERAPKGRTLSATAMEDAAFTVADALADEGLSEWLATVNTHHSSSYRHSLLVAGTATFFAQFIGASRTERARVAKAALAHDVGKSLIPLSILDKPGKLDAAEETEVHRHPQLGYDLLTASGGFSRDTLEAVLNHHEMCDGSGYPNGLKGAEISDLTRVITIADIFAALVEERAYKAALSHTEAAKIMNAMGDKLDRDLLRVFNRMIFGEAGLKEREKSSLAS